MELKRVITRRMVIAVTIAVVLAGVVGGLLAAQATPDVLYRLRTALPAASANSAAGVGLVVEEYQAAVSSRELIDEVSPDEATAGQVRSSVAVNRVGGSSVVVTIIQVAPEVDGETLLRDLVSGAVEDVRAPEGEVLQQGLEAATTRVEDVSQAREDFLEDAPIDSAEDYRNQASLVSSARLRVEESRLAGEDELADGWRDFADGASEPLASMAAAGRRLDALERRVDEAAAVETDAQRESMAHEQETTTALDRVASADVVVVEPNPTTQVLQGAIAAAGVVLVMLVLGLGLLVMVRSW